MRYKDEFDQILDDALAEYREAEPLAGLEDRVLQRLRLQAERRRKLWWRWSAITAVAAALVVAAWIGLGNRTRQEVVTSSVVQKQVPPIEPQSRTADARAANEQRAAKPTVLAKSVSHGARVPTPAQFAAEHAAMGKQFPSGAPLKPEERMLLVLATTHPEILMDMPDDDKEIAIAPISIKPLVDEAGGSQGEN
jgi:hypothetical protein